MTAVFESLFQLGEFREYMHEHRIPGQPISDRAAETRSRKACVGHGSPLVFGRQRRDSISARWHTLHVLVQLLIVAAECDLEATESHFLNLVDHYKRNQGQWAQRARCCNQFDKIFTHRTELPSSEELVGPLSTGLSSRPRQLGTAIESGIVQQPSGGRPAFSSASHPAPCIPKMPIHLWRS